MYNITLKFQEIRKKGGSLEEHRPEAEFSRQVVEK